MSVPIRKTIFDLLDVGVYATNADLGQAAAEQAILAIRAAIADRGRANVILATGNSQLSLFAGLRAAGGVDWSKVTVFHMDEYVGLTDQHPASFPRFLREKILGDLRPGAFHPIAGDALSLEHECARYADLLRRHPADLCCLGYGENGHIAFNDPPFAEFRDPTWVKVVRLAEASRRQQVGEGHFPTLADVPTHAITLTIPALLAARRLLCIVPEKRKAAAVKAALTGPVTEDCPGSILRANSHATLFLDADSASLLPTANAT
jgi:glucosamine-6-phosphate deaminase